MSPVVNSSCVSVNSYPVQSTEPAETAKVTRFISDVLSVGHKLGAPRDCLQVRAAKAFLGPLNTAADFKRMADLVREAPIDPCLRGDLIHVAADIVRGGTWPNSPDIAETDLAEKLVMMGARWDIVRDALGICSPESQEELELMAVDVPARERVKNGEQWDIVCDALGICSPEARETLEWMAVDGPARERVRNGESCDIVCDALGIRSPERRRQLELIAVADPAASRAAQ